MKLLLIIITCFSASLNAQNHFDIDFTFSPNWQKMELKGEVKTLTQHEHYESIQANQSFLYTFDSLGRLLDVKQQYGDTLSVLRNVYVYQGVLLTKYKSNYNYHHYEYNESGKVQMELKVGLSFRRGRIHIDNDTTEKNLFLRKADTILYFYNDKNQLVERKEIDNQKSFGYISTYKYNKSGKLILKKEYSVFRKGKSIKTELEYVQRIRYNSMGKPVKVTFKDEDYGMSQTFTYNYDGNITEETFTEKDNGKSVLKYNNNQMVESTRYSNQNIIEQHIRYAYEFDEQGNWIQQTITNSNGLVDTIIRKFEYF